MERNLNDYIRKSHRRMVEKFDKELGDFARMTGEVEPTLYEDATTSFTLACLTLDDGCLVYSYDGEGEIQRVVDVDEETGEYYEVEGADGIVETIRFWRSCLRRARRYWAMDTEKLDAIQSGEAEDDGDDDGQEG